jgi:hypothetical protein
MEDLFSAAQEQCMAQQQMNTNNMFAGQQQMMPQQDMFAGQQMYQNPYPAQGGYNDYSNPYGGYNNPYGGYGQQQMYNTPQGSMDRYGNIKYSRQEYMDGLRNYIMYNCKYQVAINKEEKLEDLPPRLRHCCAYSKSKIVMLDKLFFNVPETGMSIPFYFCKDCGKLFYYKDFMM